MNTPFITIQPAQGSVVGEYDVHLPPPYPYHIGTAGEVLRQDVWKGDPFRLMGFQRDLDVQEVAIFEFHWVPAFIFGAVTARDEVIGMYPVFLRTDGSMYADTRPVESVSVRAAAVTA